MTGSNVALVAPCAAEGFRIYSATTFTFQFANRQNEVAPTAQYGQAIGAAVNAEETASTDWWLEIAAPLGNPFQLGETLGFLEAGSGTVYVRPIRPGGR